MNKGLNDFLDKHEGREVGSSTKAIKKERERQGYEKHGGKLEEKKERMAKKLHPHRWDKGSNEPMTHGFNPKKQKD